jgi:hypothetical protein
MKSGIAGAVVVVLLAGAVVDGQAQGGKIPPAAEQIAGAVTALPKAQRDGATVLGYGPDGKMTSLRKGTSGMTCLASDPAGREFHSACYHDAMEPFMARGRELREQGVKDPEVDSVRFREAKSGKLPLPKTPASLFQLFGGAFDPKTGEVTGARPLYVVYIPYATTATTGIPDKPAQDAPWIMFPGTPKAHIMFVPKM